MLQAFEWYVPDDQKHWQRLHDQVEQLKATGVDNMWIPPGCKASSPSGNGYDIYDLYDLGEFDQKGGKSTKWGNKEQLVALANKAKSTGMGIYWDAGMLTCLLRSESTNTKQFSTTRRLQITRKNVKLRKSTTMTETRPFLILTKSRRGSDLTSPAVVRNTRSRSTIGITSPVPIITQRTRRLQSTRFWVTRPRVGLRVVTLTVRRVTMIT